MAGLVVLSLSSPAFEDSMEHGIAETADNNIRFAC